MNTSPIDWILVSNPSSGRSKARIQRRGVETELKHSGYSFKTIEENELDSSIARLRELLVQSPPVFGVIAFGGDGTIHHVANAILRWDPAIALGIIPSGTGNDFARQCGIDQLAPREVLEILKNTKPQAVDVISVNERFCLQVLSTGFDAQVSARAWRLPAVLRKFRYILSLLIEVARLKTINYELNINGEIRAVKALMISCANGRNYGGGMLISPDSNHQDGIFELIILHEVSRMELLKVFPRIFKGSHINHPSIEVIKVKEVNIAGSTIAQGDGEPIADAGVQLRIRSDRLLVWKL